MLGGFGSYPSNPSAIVPPYAVDRPAETQSPSALDDFFIASVNYPSVSYVPSASMLNPGPIPSLVFEELGPCGTHGVPLAKPYNLAYVSAELGMSRALRFPGYHGSKEMNQTSDTFPGENRNGLGLDAYDAPSKSYSDNKVCTFRDLEKRSLTSTGTGQGKGKHFTATCPDVMSTYNPNNLVFEAASNFPEYYARDWPTFCHPIDPRGIEFSGTRFQDKIHKQHAVFLDDPAKIKGETNIDLKPPLSVVPLPLPGSERKVRFDPTHIKVHLEGDDNAIGGNNSSGNELPAGKSACIAAFGNFLGAEFNYHGSATESNESIKHINNSLEVLDHQNQTIDSPCWRGAMFSQSASSNEDLSTSPSGYLLFDNYRLLDNISESPAVRPLPPSLLSNECESYDASKAKPGSAKPDFCRPSDKEIPFIESINVPEPRLCPTSKQKSGENSLLESEKKTIERGCSSNVMLNANDVSNIDSSHRLFPPAKDISSEEHKEVALDKLLDLHNDDMVPLKIDVQSLVNAMKTLSEFLLCECSNKRNKLKKQDCETLKNTMVNLDNCIKNTTGQMTKPVQTSTSQQAVTRPFPNLVKHHEDTSLINTLVENIPDSLGPSVHNCFVVGEKQGDGYLDETLKDDMMTQSIKSLMARNFPDEEEEVHPQVSLYKNLWLEAEAALCSMTYMARFNRVKNEMERDKSIVAKGSSIKIESLSRGESLPFSSTCEKETALNISQAKNSYENEVMARLAILKCRDLDSESVDAPKPEKESFPVLPAANMDRKLDPTVDKVPNICDVNSPNLDASTRVNDVRDILQILKCQVEEPKSENTLASDKNGQSLMEQKCYQKPEMPTPDGCEAPEIARLNVLKACAEDSPSTRNKDVIVNANSASALLDTNRIPSHWTWFQRDEPSPRGFESPSSDWEHVLKEELAGQNC